MRKLISGMTALALTSTMAMAGGLEGGAAEPLPLPPLPAPGSSAGSLALGSLGGGAGALVLPALIGAGALALVLSSDDTTEGDE